jgi:Rps23 Pro-64 3,4-dihydroxylase Tpa1-like proline 4-hydroxylase
MLDFDRLDAIAARRRAEFAAAEPFPYAQIDDFLPVSVAERVVAELERPGIEWDHYHHYNEKKRAISSADRMGPEARALLEVLQSRRFVDWVEALTGIPELLSDPDLDGAGLHETLPGGFLNVHTDFLSHGRQRTWSRQVNLLLYFNQDWRSEWNGDLELWDRDMTRCVRKVEPVFNRAFLFQTSSISYHGHPHRLSCPPGRSRKSMALYYFRDEGGERPVRSTHYRALPEDSVGRRFLVAADRNLLRAYSFLKRHTGISNRAVTRLLKRL